MFVLLFFFFFKQKTAYEISACLVGSEMCIRDRVDTNRDLYTALSTRLKETHVSASLLLSNISVVARADVPIRRSGPRTGLNLLIGCLLGLVGGVTVAFLFEYLDTSIRDPREVESM